MTRYAEVTVLHRRSFLSGLGASAVVTLSPRLFAADERVIAIQPLGKLLPEADVDLVKRALAAFYVVKVTVLPRAELPKRAYYKKRRRYRAAGQRRIGTTSGKAGPCQRPLPCWH